MTAGTLVSVEEYLNTTYRPDCDYIDGKAVERNLGELNHGRLQGVVCAWLLGRESKWRTITVIAVRLKINLRRFRIPDVMVMSADAPYEKVVVTPPLLCIEILSPCDTLSDIWDRIQDYLSISVPVCWIVDPESRRGWMATSAGMVEVKDGILNAGDIAMPLTEVLE